jgi:type II secretory pathway pseudopilin PulG
MKAPFGKKLNEGFSTLEIMIAMVIIVIVLAGSLSANFAAQYWAIASETSNEALYKAKTKLENYRALAKSDFYQATSSPLLPDACVHGQLCYFTGSTVTDLSSCSKYAQANAHWQVDRYPTTTTSLFTNLTNIPETIALGGDCLLQEPEGDWGDITASSTADFMPGSPTGIDTLNGNVYITEDKTPWLEVKSATSTSFSGCTGCNGPYNAIDVARNLSTGRVYAYVAATTTMQLQIIDVTDPISPNWIASASLSGPLSQGWRIVYYGQKVYITSRYIIGASPEFHVFDVSNPFAPAEIGTADIDTSPYGIVIRDQMFGGSMHRFAYLAATHDLKEVIILDVTDPAAIGTPITLDLPEAGCTLADSPDATTLSLLGTTLWVGREHSASCDSLPSLYAINVSDPASPTIISQVVTDSTITGLKVSGNRAYLETSSWAGAPGTGLLDMDEQYMYAARTPAGTTGVEAWSIDPLDTRKLSSDSPLGHSLQIFQSP